MTSVLKMLFEMTGGKTVTINLADPKTGLMRNEVMTAMGAIVDGSVLIYNNLDVVSAKDAYIYTTNKVELPDE